MDDEEIALLWALANDDDDDDSSMRRRERPGRIWVHEINTKREQLGEFYTLVPDLLNDERRFYIYFRMTIKCFDEILNLIRSDITKQTTNFRKPIPPEERLAVTIRYLATGDSLSTIAHSYRMGFSTVSKIIQEVCEALWTNLKTDYMPEISQARLQISEGRFREKWGFPNCVGAIDGKHITVKCPDNAGSLYYSYLKKHSIVLLAIVGPEKEFISIDVGGYGKNSDGRIFEESIMGQRLNAGMFNLPDDMPLPGQITPTPHIILGDQAFALSEYLLRPYPYTQARNDPRKENFNNRLGSTRKVVENAFGILTMKFRLFLRPIEMHVVTIPVIISAACVLHNFLRFERVDDAYIQALLTACPIDGQMVPLDQIHQPRTRREVYNIRERFTELFNS